MDDRSSLVYSTKAGRIKEEKKSGSRPPPGDGIVRVTLKRLGGNKALSSVTGLDLDEEALKDLCRFLKQKCGVGGTVKDFTIEIQGDKRSVIQVELEKKGYRVKLAGG